MNINFSEMPYDELVEFSRICNSELEARRNKERNELWRAVVKAIKSYNGKFGAIIAKDNYGNDVYIDVDSDYTLDGVIEEGGEC